MQRRYFAVLAFACLAAAFLWMGTPALDLVYFAGRSLMRMLAAYALSIVFSFTVGILILHSKKAHSFIFPILDVLQAVPIFGFFPFALLFFVNVFPGGMIGSEFASVFLIFTSMTWAITFAVIESASSITNDMRDMAKMLGIKGTRYLSNLFLPVSFPQFVSGSITGWGGGWYFLVASEYLSLGGQNIALPGLGTFIARSAFSYNIAEAAIGVMFLGLMVFGMNVYIWQPLLNLRGYSGNGQSMSKSDSFALKYLLMANTIFMAALEKASRFADPVLEWLAIRPENSVPTSGRPAVAFADIIIVIIAALLAINVFMYGQAAQITPLGFLNDAFRSVLRIGIGLGIAVAWTLLTALLIGRNKGVLKYLMPLFDLMQSIPAVSIFPIIVVALVMTIGGTLGLEIASILLVLTGMQWYLLFNLIRAAQNTPDEIHDLADIIGIGWVDRAKSILVPAMMPALLVGCLQAIGGGWNASIVSEYIISPEGQPFTMPGLGFLISSSTAAGRFFGISAGVLAITLIILCTNKFLWKPQIAASSKYMF
jgi:NitT/TauT family transport system permease protein